MHPIIAEMLIHTSEQELGRRLHRPTAGPPLRRHRTALRRKQVH